VCSSDLVSPGSRQRVTFTAPGRGWYYVEAQTAAPGFGSYTLTLGKVTAPKKKTQR